MTIFPYSYNARWLIHFIYIPTVAINAIIEELGLDQRKN